MIHQLNSMIGDEHTQVGLPSGAWVRAVPSPFYGGLFDRIRDALAVLKGDDVFAVRWPVAGDLERALSPKRKAA